MSNEMTAVRLTRRHMLAALSASAVATAVEAAPGAAVGRAAAAPVPAAGADLGRGSLSDWSALIGRKFKVAGTGGASLKLVAVEPVTSGGPRPGNIRRNGFAAVFEASTARAPEGDQTYLVAHGLSAPLPLFLSPPAPVSGKSRLVAVFN